MNNLDKKALSIVKAIAFAENGGQPTAIRAGKTGEMASIFQFMPDTWDLYSEQASGSKMPLTPENEATVVYAKVKHWYDDDIARGYTPQESIMRIASRWNAGEQRPDAYKQNFKGVNKKYGVAYDTPAYAKKVLGYANKFEGEIGVSPTVASPKREKMETRKSPGLLQEQMKGRQVETRDVSTPMMKQTRQV